MDLKILHYKCQRVVKSAFEDFKHYIKNAIFEVNDSIVEIELNSMKQTIITKMNNWFADSNYSEKQYVYMKHVISYYEDIAIKTALRFAKKHYRES
ncbi:hypothetical protein [Xanthomarina spongicola]|uniref:Uncharacterized protein n=1 Tax=Xanthomarina spongicola TaxID=570520 RepID=A0A316DQV0_9FLAO|nr:hypothetical protein [Xanthomarina spongicola]PWK19549.1 hypothetical protein LX78_00897 [Xanthomarina spongicola]